MANILIKQGREIAGSSLVTPSSKADKTDLTDIIQTGTTSSQAISAGKYFYLNDVLVKAKVDIANGATFTLNTNYEVVTAGGLNELNEKLKSTNITFTPSSGITVMYNNSKMINGIAYIDMFLRASSSITSRISMGYFTNIAVSGYKRFTTYASAAANGMVDRFTNGYINVNQLWIGDGATGGMIDIGLCITIPLS